VFVRQSAPATDGDQPRITLLREDRHTPSPTIREATDHAPNALFALGSANHRWLDRPQDLETSRVSADWLLSGPVPGWPTARRCRRRTRTRCAGCAPGPAAAAWSSGPTATRTFLADAAVIGEDGPVEVTTLAELGTALGTLVLALATFAAVRSANRSTLLAERSLLAAIRPLLVSSRLLDDDQKVGFVDDHWVTVKGGRATAEAEHDAVYLTISLRNVGTGLAILNGWRFFEERPLGVTPAPSLDEFHRLTRDIYIAPQEIGFWQGVFRDPQEELFLRAQRAVTERAAFTIDLLYGDADGGQRVITRFSVLPLPDDDGWMTAVSRQWNVDRDDPR